MYDGTDAVGSMNCPGEKGNASNRCKVCLHREEMANLVHGEPDGREHAQPEKEETDKVFRRRTGACGHRVRQTCVTRPDSGDHQGDTFTCRAVSCARGRVG